MIIYGDSSLALGMTSFIPNETAVRREVRNLNFQKSIKDNIKPKNKLIIIYFQKLTNL